MLKRTFCTSNAVFCFALGFALCAFLSGCADSKAQNAESQRKNQMETEKKIFLVIYKPGGAWVKGKPVSEQPLHDHGKYLLELYKSGILKFAGPFTDDTGAAAALEVFDEVEARNLLERDPAVINKIMVYETRPWRLVAWENYLKK
jgi:uncharacterized protein YciI